MGSNVQCGQKFSFDLHVSAAVLDMISYGNSKKVVQVWVQNGDKEHLIANLDRQTPQFSLDIGFSQGENVTFSTKGPGDVHLHGYYLLDDVANEKM